MSTSVSTAHAEGTRPVRRFLDAKQTFDAFLSPADVRLNGERPWDVQVHHDDFYARVLSGGTLALGEAYMDGWWDCDALDEMATRLTRASLHNTAPRALRARALLLAALLWNRQHPRRAFEVGRRHYDLDNDLFEAMLGHRMAYSCAYWRNARTLDEAQEAKLDLICRKIGLQPGEHVLDIGCGWGSFAGYAAEHYGARVTGLTISHEQAALARERCKGLPVEIRSGLTQMRTWGRAPGAVASRASPEMLAGRPHFRPLRPCEGGRRDSVGGCHTGQLRKS